MSSIYPMASFRSELANTLFGSAPDPTRETLESERVERFERLIAKATSTDLFKLGPFIDAMFIPALSGRNRLHVAKLMEARAPSALEHMPTLRRDREHLRRSAELARIISPESLERFRAALMATAKKEGG